MSTKPPLPTHLENDETAVPRDATRLLRAPDEVEASRWLAILPRVQAAADRARTAGKAPLRILDVGCGRGWQANLLSAYGDVEAIDPDAAKVEEARRIFPGLRASALSAEELARSSEVVPFDLVVAAAVLEHVPAGARPAFAAALASLLAPGGVLLLTAPAALAGDADALLRGAGMRAALGHDGAAGPLAPPAGAGEAAVQRVFCAERAGAGAPPRVERPGPPASEVVRPPGGPRSFDPERPDYALTPVSPLRPRRDYRPADPGAPPAVTIVTPFFNTGPVFHDTAASVFRQSLQQWEWIVVDDGSTDPAARRLLDEYQARDPRLRVIRRGENRGPSAARNLGFREARAPLVFQLDADDLIEPTALEKMAWHLATHPEHAFTTGFTVGFGSQEYVWRRGFHDGNAMLQENLVTVMGLVRKGVHEAIGGYDESNPRGMEDWEFWLKAAAHGHWGSTIGEIFGWYRRRETGRDHWENIVQREKGQAFREQLQRRYPRLWKEGVPRVQVGRTQLVSSVDAPVPFANRLASERPRMLFLVPHLELGGADKFNLDLIRQLQDDHGYEVTVVATRTASHPWRREFERLTPDVFTLSTFLHVSDAPLFLRYLIESRRPEVVCVSNSLLGYQLLPYLRAHHPDVAFVDYIHMEEEGWIAGGYPRVSVRHQTQLARTVVSSQHLKDWLVERGADAAQVEVCTTNIDADRWSRARHDADAVARKWGIDRTRPVILHAGRICEQKQPRVLAEAIRLVAQEQPDFTLLVAGEGPDLPWLKGFVERERLAQVRFLGAVPNDAIAELLAVTDVFFLPSLWEGISLALYEAMAMEAVPVSAIVGGQAELVTPDCGVLVARGEREAEDYARALVELLRHPERRRELARAGRRRIVERFPIAEMGRRMDAAFRRAREAVPGRRGHLASREVAALLAGAVVEQARITDYADALHAERNLQARWAAWRPSFEAGRALLAEGSTGAALRALDEAVSVAAATRAPQVELAARLRVAELLHGVDRARAAGVLRGALVPAERAEGRAGRENLERVLRELEAELPREAAGEAKGADRDAPAVSVVIPCYGQARFLPEAVESVVAQTFQDWELVIVNDGSPDDTSAVARALIARHPGRRIRLVEQPNGGLPGARNAGIRASRGRYVLPLDADDEIRPPLLEKLVAILDASPRVGFAYTDIQHFGDVDTAFPLPDFDAATMIAKDNIGCVCSLFRRSAWEQVGGYDESMREGYEDWDFWVGCIEHGWEGYCLHEPLFLYRKRGSSMLTQANAKRERLVATIVRNHPKLYDERSQRWASGVLERHAAAASSKA